jgi:hypothetical protein
LPDIQEARIRVVEGNISALRPRQPPAQRYLAQGSSITNGAIGKRPSDACLFQTGSAFGSNAFNFGFAGGASKLQSLLNARRQHLSHALHFILFERGQSDFGMRRARIVPAHAHRCATAVWLGKLELGKRLFVLR